MERAKSQKKGHRKEGTEQRVHEVINHREGEMPKKNLLSGLLDSPRIHAGEYTSQDPFRFFSCDTGTSMEENEWPLVEPIKHS